AHTSLHDPLSAQISLLTDDSLQSASALANQSSRSQARAERGLRVRRALDHSTRVRPRRNGRAGICAAQSKAPAVPRADTDHTGPAISPGSMPMARSPTQAVQGSELTAR